MTDLEPYLKYPAGGPDSWGPRAWHYFEDVANSIPCGECRPFAQQLVSASHDVVNILKKGRAPYNRANLLKFAETVNKAVSLCHSRHQCSPRHSSGLRPHGLTACEKKHPEVVRKIERCVLKVKHQRGVSPFAVCRASIGCDKKAN